MLAKATTMSNFLIFKKTFLLYFFLCFFNTHSMEVATAVTCTKVIPVVTTKVIPIIATKVVPIVGAKLTSILAGIGSSKIILFGAAAVAGIGSFLNREPQVAMNNPTEEHKHEEDDQIHVQNVLSNDFLLLENKEKLSSIYSQTKDIENYRKILERRYRFFIVLPGFNDNILYKFPRSDRYNFPLSLPSSNNHATPCFFPGFNKGNIPLRCPGKKSPKYCYFFDSYTNTSPGIITIVNNNNAIVDTHLTHNTYQHHTDPYPYYDGKNLELRNKCHKAPTLSKFKEMQLNGEIKELEAKLMELEEKLKLASPLRIITKIKIRKQIKEIKEILAEELTEIILTIQDSDLEPIPKLG